MTHDHHDHADHDHKGHSHAGHSHAGHSHSHGFDSDTAILWAVLVNLALTVARLVLF